MASDDRNTGGLVGPRRQRELVRYLINTFLSLLPADQAPKFQKLAAELEAAVDDNCANCAGGRVGVVTAAPAAKDPRRHRFLLRVVVARVSHLFVGDAAIFPKSLVEGIDRYLTKALGEIVYEELNRQSEALLAKLNTDDDKEIWQKIQQDADARRFAETILIRILLKFENFQGGKRTFMSVVGMAMSQGTKFQFKDGHFHILWEAMFGEFARSIDSEQQRVFWDYQFGEETSRKLQVIFARAKADKAPPKAVARR